MPPCPSSRVIRERSARGREAIHCRRDRVLSAANPFSHTALAQLTLDRVAVREGGGEAGHTAVRGYLIVHRARSSRARTSAIQLSVTFKSMRAPGTGRSIRKLPSRARSQL